MNWLDIYKAKIGEEPDIDTYIKKKIERKKRLLNLIAKYSKC
ncbi:hypothetical protein [Candidatus Endomicrobiellum cubanum]|jgi:hypothetical protein